MTEPEHGKRPPVRAALRAAAVIELALSSEWSISPVLELMAAYSMAEDEPQRDGFLIALMERLVAEHRLRLELERRADP